MTVTTAMLRRLRFLLRSHVIQPPNGKFHRYAIYYDCSDGRTHVQSSSHSTQSARDPSQVGDVLHSDDIVCSDTFKYLTRCCFNLGETAHSQKPLTQGRSVTVSRVSTVSRVRVGVSKVRVTIITLVVAYGAIWGPGM